MIVRIGEGLIAEDETAARQLMYLAFCKPPEDDPAMPRIRRIGELSRNWMMEPMRTEGPFDFGDEGH
jgi:hypothetical protein